MKPYLFLCELKVFVKLFYIRLVRPYDLVRGKKVLYFSSVSKSVYFFAHLSIPHRNNWYVSKLEAAFWHSKFREKSAVNPQRFYNLSKTLCTVQRWHLLWKRDFHFG